MKSFRIKIKKENMIKVIQVIFLIPNNKHIVNKIPNGDQMDMIGRISEQTNNNSTNNILMTIEEIDKTRTMNFLMIFSKMLNRHIINKIQEKLNISDFIETNMVIFAKKFITKISMMIINRINNKITNKITNRITIRISKILISNMKKYLKHFKKNFNKCMKKKKKKKEKKESINTIKKRRHFLNRH